MSNADGILVFIVIMTQIYIDGNDIKRIQSLKFDIDAPISYEYFCGNPKYEELFEDIKKKDSHVSLSFVNFSACGYSGWINQNIQRKIDLFIEYDFIEEFRNGMKYPWWYNADEDKELPRNKWFYDEIFDFQINEMQHYFTKNHVVLNEELRKERVDYGAVLIYPELLCKIKYDGDYDTYLETGRNTRKAIKFTQELKQHKRMEYIAFMALISDEPFYLVTDSHFFNYHIVSESNLFKYTKHFALVQNISGYIKSIQDQETLEEIERLKKLYGKDKIQMKKVMEDLMDMIKKTGTVNIKLSIQNENPMYMSGQFRTVDQSKYQELKDYTSDYGYVTHKNHKGSKKIIVGEKEFKYKKSGKLKKDK